MANNTEILALEARLQDFFSENMNKIVDSLDKFKEKGKKSTTEVTSGFNKFKNQLVSSAKQALMFLSVAGLMTAGIAAIKGEISKTIAVYTEFESSLSKVEAIMLPTTKEMAAMEMQARKLGSTTAFTASQAAEAFLEMGKRGFEASQAIAASEGVLNLAAAANMQMADSAALVTATLNQFNLAGTESGRVADIAAKSFNSSALEAFSFSEAMKMSGAVAENTGTSLEELTSFLSVLADREIKGTLAGTALRRMLLELANSSSKASKRVKEIDPSATTVTEKLKALQKANIDATEATDLFGLRATTAAQILIGNTDAVDKLTDSYKNADGTAKNAADTMLNNVAGATKILKSAQDELRLSIGATFAEAQTDLIKSMTKAFISLADIVKANSTDISQALVFFADVIKFTGRAAEALGRVIIGSFNMIASGINTVIEKSLKIIKFFVKMVNETANLINEIKGKITGKKIVTKDLIDLTGLNFAIKEFEDGAQRQADAAFTAFTGITLQTTAIEKLTEATKKKNQVDKDVVVKEEDKPEIHSKQIEVFKKIQEDQIETAKKAWEQRLEAQKLAQNAQIASMQDTDAREIAALDFKFSIIREKYAGNAEALKNIEAAYLLEKDKLEKEQAARSEQTKQKEFDISINAGLQMTRSLQSFLSTQRNNFIEAERAKINALDVSQEKKEKLLEKLDEKNRQMAKKEKAIAISQAIINTAVNVSKVLANPFAVAAISAAGALQVATIAKQKFKDGGIVEGNDTEGDNVNVGVNSGEMILNKSQQATLFNIAQGKEKPEQKSQNQLVINLTINPGQMSSEGERDTILTINRIGDKLTEALRDNKLENFVREFKKELV